MPQRPPRQRLSSNALVVIDDQRAGGTGTVEAQLDIIWPTTGTPNSTDAPGRPLFSNDWQSVNLSSRPIAVVVAYRPVSGLPTNRELNRVPPSRIT